ncbi:hypothetical protein SCLARK_001280 [Spiroplasma clarkii]|uniref:Uncharacterized protein n=1 Tax=Spiroplasma clarkii TaxID=2139 RepID=A0A1Y0L217_9MOLU|nr:hypothetical protein [Spiroplasma clarkii]ARU91820.1 hypothetical protein SCLARK_001280 [Spiroplasma clarkii]ATX71184.1 hypothetical protein SCLAR_v1c08760 [Spiroplasma clarkii]
MIYLYCSEKKYYNKLNKKINICHVDKVENILAKFNPSQDRLIIVGKRLHQIVREITQLTGFVVIQYFSDIDWLETIKTNGANTLALDTILHSFDVVEWVISKWINVPDYEKDNYHDEYVVALRTW